MGWGTGVQLLFTVGGCGIRQNGHFTCYLNRTYHVLPTNPPNFCGAERELTVTSVVNCR